MPQPQMKYIEPFLRRDCLKAREITAARNSNSPGESFPNQPNQTTKYHKNMTLNKFIKTLVGAILVTGSLIQAKADVTSTSAVDPTGSYIWVMPGRNGGPDRTNTLVLKLDGDKLTGKLMSPRRDGQTNTTDIADGKVTGAVVTFSVVRTYNDNTFTNLYTGTLGDTSIKGKVEFTRDSETQSRDWEAKKQ
jgi:hypothetical protein